MGSLAGNCFLSMIHHQSIVQLYGLYIGFSKVLLSHITNQAFKLQPRMCPLVQTATACSRTTANPHSDAPFSVVRPLFVQQHAYDSLHGRNSCLLVQILVVEHALEEPVKERSYHR